MGISTASRFISAVNRGFFIVALNAFLIGCSTSPDSGVGKVVEMTKSLVGMETAAEKAGKSKDIALKLHGAANLNADPSGRGLAVVSRVYFLKDASAFQQLPRDAFEDATKLGETLKQDLLAVREQVVIPGKQYDLKEKVAAEANYLGVVALFRSDKNHRWRLVLPLAELDTEKPLVLGLHSCVITVSDGLKNEALLKSLSLIGTTGCH